MWTLEPDYLCSNSRAATLAGQLGTSSITSLLLGFLTCQMASLRGTPLYGALWIK